VIRAGAGLVMAEVVPGIAVFAVVFADGAPLALTKVRSPLSPGSLVCPGFLESQGLRISSRIVLLFGPICLQVNLAKSQGSKNQGRFDASSLQLGKSLKARPRMRERTRGAAYHGDRERFVSTSDRNNDSTRCIAGEEAHVGTAATFDQADLAAAGPRRFLSGALALSNPAPPVSVEPGAAVTKIVCDGRAI